LDDSYDLVINSTSISTRAGKSLGLPKALFLGTKLAYDLFYSDEKTVFMKEASKNKAEKVSDGWGMLVEQGAESFRLWTNLIPDTSRLLEKPID
jgi:shikimate dehydrogenase